MDWTPSVQRPCALESSAAHMWILALLLFGLGDIVTTALGLHVAGVVETHPIAQVFFQYSVLGTMGALKLAVFGGFYGIWKLVPRPHSLGIPLGLAVLGGIVTSWNLRVVLVALAA
ncbi:hypothetical protein [Haloarcula nitratireducens]|uniref:DUF5658 domain-containing protein n=1 Tax=Haloarcula nitratireducens TaxID=2487749 RepID=A0AAW4PKN5_9EURY|nr:hypothetical protein [Halomicroarcula nitratireducens]MBX0297860.1 hypothetical protein [Halomicroarcula nitratireducens]